MGLDADNPRTEVIQPQRIEPNRALAEPGELSVGDLVAQVRKVQEVMGAVMKQGHHYGVIPGCGDKPTLFKPGAEKLALVFRLCPSFDVTQTEHPHGHREYRVLCTLSHITTGAMIAQGVGTGSTMEAKYRWRQGQRKCPKCGKPSIIKGKAEYGGGWLCWAKKDGCGATWKDGAKEIEGQSVDRVENPDIADTYNTVLKMAKKRAQIDATLTATGASDIFAQDLEDLADAAPVAAPPPAKRHDPSKEEQEAEFSEAFDEGAKIPKDAPIPAEHQATFALYRDKIEKAQSKEMLKALFADMKAAGLPTGLRERLHKFAGGLAAERKRQESREPGVD